MILLEVRKSRPCCRPRRRRPRRSRCLLVKQLHYSDHACREADQVSSYRETAHLIFIISSRPSSLDVQFVDFDDVRFHLSTPERKTQLVLSMSIRCWDELAQYGVHSILQREYGSMVKAQPEPEYNVSLELDLEQFPAEPGKLGQRLLRVSLMSFRGAGGTRQVHIAS